MDTSRSTNAEIAVADAETDPFKYDRIPKPFVFGYADRSVFFPFWGDRCVVELVACIRQRKPNVLYAHNGGKFDWMFLLPYLENPIKIINGRIASARIGTTELRDSWNILPFPLEQFDKDTKGWTPEQKENFYAKFEATERQIHKASILDYLRNDCENLLKLVTAFRERFGSKLTVASTAMGELRKRHDYPHSNASHDSRFRQFFFGGRVQCFEIGQIYGKLKLYDVNSMYPKAMRDFWHPRGMNYTHFNEKDFGRFCYGKGYPYFLRVRCASDAAFPLRNNTMGLAFPITTDTFHVTDKEFEAAYQLGLLSDIQVLDAWQCEERQRFDTFVDDFFAERETHRLSGNEALRLSTKYVLNSAYGKFAQNPEDHFDYHIRRAGDPVPGDHSDTDHPWSDFPPWQIATDYGGIGEIWHRPVPPNRQQFFDVAIAASITGAARSILMRALRSATRPVYCDTDSILCESLPQSLVGESLGLWKLEAECDEAFIAGKKLYALFRNGELVKSSAKGVQKSQLTRSNWCDLIRGAELEIANPVPNFKIDGSARFTKRRIKSSGTKEHSE